MPEGDPTALERAAWCARAPHRTDRCPERFTWLLCWSTSRCIPVLKGEMCAEALQVPAGLDVWKSDHTEQSRWILKRAESVQVEVSAAAAWIRSERCWEALP